MINETERASNGNGSANVMIAFLTGASIGAAAGLLLAPKTGRESRGQLRGYFQKTRDRLRSMKLETGNTAAETKPQDDKGETDAGQKAYARSRNERTADV